MSEAKKTQEITLATVDTDRIAKAIVALTTAYQETAVRIAAAADALAKWIRANSAAIEAHRELETALRWASCYNRPLFQRFNRTKKKRIRKKYAKRVLEWYRTEVVANDLRNI